MKYDIPFNRPYMTGQELLYIKKAHEYGGLAGDGVFTKKCHKWLEGETHTAKALLTHSCTAALEMSALLIDIKEGDEIIMPSFTFVSTANAFVLRGGVPVFVDIRSDTLNIDESLIESAITSRTRAIIPVHYAGVACNMDPIMSISKRHQLYVIEDAAQALMSKYKGRSLGGIGDLGAYSFHETKNIISGEGGALLVNNPKYVAEAEIIREKGTDRSRFFAGEVDKYTWQSVGSSFLPGELIAAFLWAQLQKAKEITLQRKIIWNRYHELLAPLEARGALRRPIVPDYCQHNAHMYYLILPSELCRTRLIDELKRNSINAVFHYAPLHSSPAGSLYGRKHDTLDVTENMASRLLRLPLWLGLSKEEQSKIVEVIDCFL